MNGSVSAQIETFLVGAREEVVLEQGRKRSIYHLL
jgi:hypothetical protein